MPSKTIPLYTYADIAFECGVTGARMWQLDQLGILPEPFAILNHHGSRAGQKQKLFTKAQMEQIVIIYRDRKDAHDTRKRKERPKRVRVKITKPPVPKPEPEPKTPFQEAKAVFNDRELTVCPHEKCGMPVFDIKTHIDFAHKGENRKLRNLGARS